MTLVSCMSSVLNLAGLSGDSTATERVSHHPPGRRPGLDQPGAVDEPRGHIDDLENREADLGVREDHLRLGLLPRRLGAVVHWELHADALLPTGLPPADGRLL